MRPGRVFRYALVDDSTVSEGVCAFAVARALGRRRVPGQWGNRRAEEGLP